MAAAVFAADGKAGEVCMKPVIKLDDIHTEAPPKGPEDMGIPENGFLSQPAPHRSTLR